MVDGCALSCESPGTGSMPEAALPRINHCRACLVAGLDAFMVPLGTAGLDNGSDAFAQAHFNAVAEGEKRV